MNQDYPRPLLADNDVGFTRNSIATSFSHPFTRIPSNSDLQPENYSSDGEDDDSAAPLTGNCGYSRPFLFLDMIWNLAFVVVSVFVLLVTVKERPSTPLRLWVFGYALQCLLHVGFVWDEYQRRNLDDDVGAGQNFHFRRVSSFSALTHKRPATSARFASSLLVVSGLFSLRRVFYDILHCDGVHYFLLLFCCFPILATVAYAMTIGDGASENDIRSLPKYIYRQQNTVGIFENVEKQEVNFKPLPGNSISTSELVLNPEDSECCICLYKYVNGAELCTLPCNHHFHHRCITKWLRINATCPLCKFNILRGDTLV
ncbi:hypothetical protein DH2020_018717 [Rehmannia glutinosa]|uniref:RING-type E3 ubiquitin transferase n=1 Tax=Rehmannia glutinosa TaxID=99300 RepID=A0ABR0WNV0_REHGL